MSKLQKYSTMNSAIVKQMFMVITDRDERKSREAQEQAMKDDIKSIKTQMEIQLRLITEILSKQEGLMRVEG